MPCITVPVLKSISKLTKMNKPHVWGTDIELLVVAHLLKTCIHFYMTRNKNGLCIDQVL